MTARGSWIVGIAAAALVVAAFVAAPWRSADEARLDPPRAGSAMDEPTPPEPAPVGAAARVEAPEAPPDPTAAVEAPSATDARATGDATPDVVRGRVIDDSGRPVVDATIAAFDFAAQAALGGTRLVERLRRLDGGSESARLGTTHGCSAADGSFALPAPAAGARAWVAAFHHATGASALVLNQPDAIGARPEIELVLSPTLELAVHVTDRLTQRLAGATVTVRIATRAGAGVATRQITLETDQDGIARVEIAAPTALFVRARCPGFNESTMHEVELPSGRSSVDVGIELARAAIQRVSGRVVLRDGGSAGAWLRGCLAAEELADAPPSGPGVVGTALRRSPFAIGPTEVWARGNLALDEDRFEIEVDESTVVIALVARRTLLGWIERDPASPRLFRDDATLVIDPARLPSSAASGSVRLRARAADTRAPIDAAALFAWIWPASAAIAIERSSARGGATPTDDGALVFGELPLAPLQVGVRAPGYETRLTEVTLAPERPQVEVDVVLEPADATLAVTVDAAGGDVNGILLYEPDSGGWRAAPYATSDPPAAGGRWILRGLPRRRFGVLAQSVSRAPAWDEADLAGGNAELSLSLASGTQVRVEATRDEPLDPNARTAAIRVVDATGRPLVDWFHPWLRIDHGWNFGLVLPAGRYHATFCASECEPREVDFDVPGDPLLRFQLRARPR